MSSHDLWKRNSQEEKKSIDKHKLVGPGLGLGYRDITKQLSKGLLKQMDL
jgi:hypothetical protein